MDTEKHWYHNALLLSGTLVFSNEIDLGKIQQFVENLRKKHPERYEELLIRTPNRGNGLSISFKYRLPEGLGQPTSKSTAEFVYAVTDKTKRAFGNDFLEWDIPSSGTYEYR